MNKNIEIKKLVNTDIDKFVDLIQVFEHVFEMKHFERPSKSYLQNLLETEGFFVFVALDGAEVVGGLTAYTLQQYFSVSPIVYVYDLAVKTNRQRKGIGKMLMTAIVEYCKKNGFDEVFIQADKADGYAVDFYRSTGATEEQVVHFFYPLKPINNQ
jgi:aminoglycoside 3-N-acetyltransferase I